MTAQLRRHFGFERFRPLQQEIVLEALAGGNAVAILPTGSGKSLCYQLPALLLPGLTIVISPLISLMKDQVDSLVQRGISAVALTSHDTAEEGRQKLAALTRGEIKLLFVAPERLPNAAFLAAVTSGREPVSLLAVDEAHCVSQWGHDFRPEYRQIPDFHEAVGRPPMLALTATARPSVQSDLREQLGIGGARIFKASADRPNLWFGVDHCDSEAMREAKLVHLLRQAGGSAILYVTSRKEADQWADRLALSLQEEVLCYHGGMDAESRTAVQNRFMTGQVRTVVATNAFGMGIDKPDIRLVLHAGVPESLEAYFQEVGRAGRDGLPAECRMVLVPGRDLKVREHLMKQSQADELAWDRFKQMRIYLYLKEQQCRRVYLLRYFGERTEPRSANCCSICHPRAIDVAPIDRSRSRSGGKRRAGSAPAVAPDAGDARRSTPAHPLQGAILERLKLWRRAEAAERAVPAFVIFGDKDLEGIAAAAPGTLAELARCRGIGPTKLSQYGEALLAEVSTVMAEVLPPRGRTSKQESLEVTGAHFAAGRTVAETAALVGLAPSTTFAYFLEWLQTAPPEAWKPAVRQVLTPDAYRAIRAVLQVQAVQEEGRLRPIFEALDGKYTYEEIRVARVVMERSGQAPGG